MSPPISPPGPIVHSSAAIERFLARVTPEPTTGCWLWTGAQTGPATIGGCGYGILVTGSRRIYTHRMMWEITRGRIPDGMLVCHKCDFPPCVNPDHLFIGTSKDNAADMDRKGRRVVTVGLGEDNGNAHLTDQQVWEIARRHCAGESSATLANEFGIARAYVTQIRQKVAQWAAGRRPHRIDRAASCYRVKGVRT